MSGPEKNVPVSPSQKGIWASPVAKVAGLGLALVVAGGAFASLNADEEPAPAVAATDRVQTAETPPSGSDQRLRTSRPALRDAVAPDSARIQALVQKAKEGGTGPVRDERLEGLADDERQIVADVRRMRVRGQPQEAVEQMLPLLEKHPEHPALLYELALTYRLAGNRDETRALLVRSCKVGDERACKQVQGPAPARIP